MKTSKAIVLSFVVCISFAGCQNPGIVQLSPDTYILSRDDHAGIFGNIGALKAGVIRDANAFAESKGKVAIPLSSNTTPNGPGRFASFEYQFRVVDINDPEAKRTALVPRADMVIEKTEKISADVRTKNSAAKEPDLYAELTKLDDLRQRGILSNAEFEVEKKKLLDRSK